MFSGNEWMILMVMVVVLTIPVVVIALVVAATRRPSSVAASGPPAHHAAGHAVPSGWFPDPTGRYEQRYWDGASWTDAVASDGQVGTDPM